MYVFAENHAPGWKRWPSSIPSFRSGNHCKYKLSLNLVCCGSSVVHFAAEFRSILGRCNKKRTWPSQCALWLVNGFYFDRNLPPDSRNKLYLPGGLSNCAVARKRRLLCPEFTPRLEKYTILAG